MKKTELRQIIREIITEASNKEKTEFKDYLTSKYRNKQSFGFELWEDDKTGALTWSNGTIDIYATPFWEDEDRLPINIQDDGDEVYDKTFAFKLDSDRKKMETEYFKILNPILKKFK